MLLLTRLREMITLWRGETGYATCLSWQMGRWVSMVIALNLVTGKWLLRLPTKITNTWLQLANWHMPDKKLGQDIASCLLMAADVLNRPFVIDDRSKPDFEEEVHDAPPSDR